MNRVTGMRIILKAAVLVWAGVALRALGFSTDGSGAARSFDRLLAQTNGVITVTLSFTNSGTNDLRGFVYNDEVPTGMVVTPVSLTVGGQAVTNFTFETGLDGDVYPLNTPYRWVLERPTQFAESNAVPVGGTVQIVYALSAAAPGTYQLQGYSWAGLDDGSTNTEFGYSEAAEQQTLTVYGTVAPLLTNLVQTAQGFSLQVLGVPGLRYAVEASSDLALWTAVLTNASPFGFTDTNAAGAPRRFYRARTVDF